MNKQVSFVVVAAVGVIVVATWSMAQSPKDVPAAKSPSSSSTSGEGGAELLPKGKLSGGSLKSDGPSRGSLFGGSGSSAARTTTSASPGEIDSSLAPFRGGSLSRTESLPSPSSSGASIRIDHALVTSLDSIKLPARDAGAILEITVKKGVEVKADEVVGQLDDKDSKAKVRIAEKERDAARIQAENNAQIDAAKKGELVTRENLKANEEIRAKSPGALSDFDYRRSKFEWERAMAQIAVAEMEKLVAEATQLAKEAQIDGANVEIERRKIVAPIDGFINEIYKHKGEWCQPGDPVLELVRMDRLEIEGFVYAADASPSMVRGKPVDVVVQLAGGETYKASGTIRFASPVLEGSGRIRQFRVSTEIDNKKVRAADGEEHWLIQPGTEAEMTIHLAPPAPKPVTAPKTTSPAGTKSGLPPTKSGLPGGKVEAFKPAVPEVGGKSGAKSTEKGEEAKSDSKSATKSETKTDAKSTGKEPAKSDAAKSEQGKAEPAKNEGSKSGDEVKPAENDNKQPAKSSTIKL